MTFPLKAETRVSAYAYPPRLMSREEAARWVGVSPSLFDQLVADSRMPSPKRINSRVVWDRYQLDAAVEDLPDRDAGDEWKAAV
jgi:predicted DNA-binding transcriptional regulator AlpA